MPALITFFVGLAFSYLGSIPPGMINISVLQYAMQNKKAAAIWFSIAAVLVEFIYAGIAVRFQIFLTENTSITAHFQLLTAVVLVLLGISNFMKKGGLKFDVSHKEKRNAFKKGALISLANPLAIPFWLAVTTYLQSMNWITLADLAFWWYILGISLGTLLLLITIILLAVRYAIFLNSHFLVYKVPGLIFIGMGLWAFFQWFTL